MEVNIEHFPLVSIIIPTYNRAHLIGETLDSVLAQTYKNWECIVVDDGSSDNTAEVVGAFVVKDVRFKYVRRPDTHKPGGNGARNYGFEISKGEYVNWFDSDDLMMPEKLQKQVNILKSKSCDYTICQTKVFNVLTQKDMGLRAEALVSDNILKDYILYRIFWLTGAPLWKKDFLFTHNLAFDENLLQAQDYDFHIRALEFSKNYCPLKEVLVIFMQHADNMSNSIGATKEKFYSNLKVSLYILQMESLDLVTKRLVFKKRLIKLYTYAVYNYGLKDIAKVLNVLIVNHKFLKLTLKNRFKLIANLVLLYISHKLFSKGYRFTKFEMLKQ